VMPSSALGHLLHVAENSGEYGYISPICRNSPNLDLFPADQPQYSPGSLIFQDEIVRNVLLDYYASSCDVLDHENADQTVWETAVLSELFAVLGRTCVKETDTFVYHLDYHEGTRWIEDERTVVARSARLARDLVQRHTGRVEASPSLLEHSPAHSTSVTQ